MICLSPKKRWNVTSHNLMDMRWMYVYELVNEKVINYGGALWVVFTKLNRIFHAQMCTFCESTSRSVVIKWTELHFNAPKYTASPQKPTSRVGVFGWIWIVVWRFFALSPQRDHRMMYTHSALSTTNISKTPRKHFWLQENRNRRTTILQRKRDCDECAAIFGWRAQRCRIFPTDLYAFVHIIVFASSSSSSFLGWREWAKNPANIKNGFCRFDGSGTTLCEYQTSLIPSTSPRAPTSELVVVMFWWDFMQIEKPVHQQRDWLGD